MAITYSPVENSPTLPVLESGKQTPVSLRRSYRTYVKGLCANNPSLNNLYEFLSEPKPQSLHRICSLDFCSEKPVLRDVDVNQLAAEIGKEPTEPDSSNSRYKFEDNDNKKPLQGRIVVIEDLSKDIVELLGTTLDIDPLFFALHLHTIHRTSSRHQTPDEATLPSRACSQNFINISYHRIVTSDSKVPYGGKFLRDTVINRKLVFLRSTNIGLSQHCASIIRVKKRKKPWLALVLVDPPIGSVYTTNDADRRAIRLKLRHYLGTYESFVEPCPFSESRDEDLGISGFPHGMFDDLQRYWIHELPTCFDLEDPSIQTLAYFSLRIVAAEWVKYIAAMQQCLKQYEYNHEQLPTLSLDKFDRDLRELQSWRRRTLMSQAKIKSALRFLTPKYGSLEKRKQGLEHLSEDFEHIQDSIEAVGRRLESTLPVIMSFVQITDARRSFAETADISRLTILALIFVPLTFVSSLFSMNTDNLPGSRNFWIYCVVAIPLTGLVGLLARPPPIATTFLRRASQWISDLKDIRRPRQSEEAEPEFVIPRRRSSYE